MNLNPDAPISFVIPTLNGERFVKPCLEYLRTQWCEGDEILIVDNGSTDGTIAAARLHKDVEVIEKPGVTIAELRNIGARKATHDVIAFIDVDCLLMPGWRQAVLRTLANESVFATGSRYDIPDPATWIERAWFSNRMRTAGPVHYINSGNLVVKRAGFDQIRGFDASLITDEDYDFGARLRDAGLAMIEEPEVRAVHLGNAKTLLAFFRKTCWHATSGMNLRSRNRSHLLDKPMAMTVAFMVCCAVATGLLLFHSESSRFYSVSAALFAILAVPVVTSLYRVIQYRNATQFFQLVALHTVWYIARAVTFARVRILGKTTL